MGRVSQHENHGLTDRRVGGKLALVVTLVSAVVVAQAPAQTDSQAPAPAPAAAQATPVSPAKSVAAGSAAKSAAIAKSAGPPTTYLPNRFAGRAGVYYPVIWGVDSLNVRLAESGEIVRFTWRVLDAEKAKPLSNKASEPSLEDPRAGVSLVVPSMENIGQLRQGQPPEAGKAYWMAFSNKGRLVKHGDRVNVVIGQFRADGLMVE